MISQLIKARVCIFLRYIMYTCVEKKFSFSLQILSFEQELRIIIRNISSAILGWYNLPFLSRVVRKPAFYICENKDAEADQRLCFRYTDSTIPLLPKSEAIFSGCAARVVSYLVGNPEDRFSHK